MTFGLPTAHMFTFLSSPPVTITRPEEGPRDRQDTLEPCATNSSVNQKQNVFKKLSQNVTHGEPV